MQNGNEHNIQEQQKKKKQTQHIKIAKRKKNPSEEVTKPLGFIHCWSPW
jgi:hypothetical protein